MHLHIVTIPVSTISTASSLRMTTLWEDICYLFSISCYCKNLNASRTFTAHTAGRIWLLGDFLTDTPGAKGKKIIWFWEHLKIHTSQWRRWMSLPTTTTIKKMAVRLSYTRCNQPGRLEAGTESSPGQRYHLRAMGDEGAFVFFHILVFTLILCLSFACCWN